MANKLPRFKCPGCEREVAGRSTKRMGFASLVDHKREKRALELCPWSESHVPLRDAMYVQEELPENQGVLELPGQRAERLPLF